MQRLAERLGRMEEQSRDKIQKLNDEVSLAAVEPLITKLKEQYQDLKPIVDYLSAYQQDVIENVDIIVNAQENEPDAVASVSSDNAIPSRYQCNVIVSHNPKKGAPVVLKIYPLTTT